MTIEELNVKYGKPPTSGGILAQKWGVTPEPSFTERVSEDFAVRREKLAETTQRRASGEQGLPETILQHTGQVAGGVFDIASELPVVKEGLEAFGKGVGKLAETKPIKEVAKVVQPLFNIAYDKYQSLSPKDKANVDALGNIVSILPTPALSKLGVEAIKPVASVTGEVLGGIGKGVEKSGRLAEETARKSFVRNLIRPEQTKAVKEAQVPRTTEIGFGPTKRSVIAPSPSELRAENAVLGIPELKQGDTFQQSYKTIEKANIAEAIKLERDVIANDFIIPKKEIISKLNETKKTLAKSPLIVGDAEKMADKLLKGAIDFVNKNAGKGSGLLIAKKEYDAWVLSQKPKAFDSTAENAFTIANREIRNVFKAVFEEKAPNIGFKASMAKQTALYDAMENILPKAGIESDKAIIRVFQRAGEALGIRNKLAQQIGAILGVGTFSVMSTFAPTLGIGGGLIVLGYQAGKLVLKPKVRIVIGKVLQQAGHLLNPEGKMILENALKEYGGLPNKQGGFINLQESGAKSPKLSALESQKLEKSSLDNSTTLSPSSAIAKGLTEDEWVKGQEPSFFRGQSREEWDNFLRGDKTGTFKYVATNEKYVSDYHSSEVTVAFKKSAELKMKKIAGKTEFPIAQGTNLTIEDVAKVTDNKTNKIIYEAKTTSQLRAEYQTALKATKPSSAQQAIAKGLTEEQYWKSEWNKQTFITDKPITVYRGEGKGIGNYTLVKGKYFADSEKFASTFGEVTTDTIPKGVKVFDLDIFKNPNQKLLPREMVIDVNALTDFLEKRGIDYTKNTNARGVEYVKVSRFTDEQRRSIMVNPERWRDELRLREYDYDSGTRAEYQSAKKKLRK